MPVGLIALIGAQGAGKTSCASAMLCNDYKYHGKERYEECRGYTNELNNCGHNLHLPKNKCLYYSSDTIVLSKRPYVESWKVNPDFFKLPNLIDKVQYFPRGSVIFLPEFDNQINCRDWKNMDKYLVALAKYARHWGLTIIIDFQVWLQLDVSWRRLMMLVYFMYESYFDERWKWLKRLLHIPIKRVWHYVACNNQLNAFVKDLSTMKTNKRLVKKLSKLVAEDRSYYFKGNIFERFDSTSGEPYFLRGITDYEYIPHIRTDMSPEGIEEYCRTHPIVKNEKSA